MENVGGQAVVEGVMMRSKTRVATAVMILKEKKIKIKVTRLKDPPKLFKLPIIRGIYTLVDSLILGTKALIWSSNQNLEDAEKIKTSEMVLTFLFSFALGLFLFLGIPYLITKFVFGKGLWFSLMEGLIRVSLLLAYLGIISFSSEVKKLFQYHGAEHKVINCYEAGEEVTVKNVKKYPTLHTRCGTSFIFIVLIFSIITFSFLEIGWMRLFWKFLLIPVVAGFSYEFLKLSDRFRTNLLMKILIWPGLMLQKITTKEPDDQQIAVSIKAWERATSQP
ncbi:MAG: DUF1385 domain-containing protein [Candidatus Woesearchaeota archaeon]